MNVSLLIGDVRERLQELPDASVHCVVTSPPYWGLRDYGTGRWQCGRWIDRQIGLEASIDQHLEQLVAVFRDVRRVLRPDGTCWINYGDAYASGVNGRSAADVRKLGRDDRVFRDKPFSTVTPQLKAKQRLMLPARLALALQADGWWLRDEIIWHKPNPMPSSVRDRTTPAHEMLYLLSGSDRYYFDAAALAEPVVAGDKGSRFDQGKTAAVRPRTQRGPRINSATRNRRSVWSIATEAYSGAHFATFPQALVAPCILAGCPAGGVVLDPFGGSGTTALVATRLQRRAVLIELSADYAKLAATRLKADGVAVSMNSGRPRR